MYSMEQVKTALLESGFEWLGAFSDYSFSAAEEDNERWYIAARAIKK